MDRLPDRLVERDLGRRVLDLEVPARRLAGHRRGRRVQRRAGRPERDHAGHDRVVGREVRPADEALPHAHRALVGDRHRRQAEQVLDRRDHAGGVVVGGVDRRALRVRADHVRERAVGVDVVRAVLGVVLGDEDRRALPERAVGDDLDEPPEREVVVGHVGLRRGAVGGGPVRVVVGQAHEREPRERVARRIRRVELFVRTKLALPLRQPVCVVGAEHVEAGEVLVDVVAEAGVVEPGRRRRVPVALAVAGDRRVHAVAAERHAAVVRVVPQVAAGRRGGGAEHARVEGQRLGQVQLRDGAVLEVARAVRLARRGRVGDRPGLVRVVGDAGRRDPGLTVGGHVRVRVEVVEQREAAGELVVVGRGVRAEQRQRRVAVPASEVAEHLVVRAVLLDHVDHVLDRERASSGGAGAARARGCSSARGACACAAPWSSAGRASC